MNKWLDIPFPRDIYPEKMNVNQGRINSTLKTEFADKSIALQIYQYLKDQDAYWEEEKGEEFEGKTLTELGKKFQQPYLKLRGLQSIGNIQGHLQRVLNNEHIEHLFEKVESSNKREGTKYKASDFVFS